MIDTSATSKVFNLHIDAKELESTFRDMNKALQRAVVNSLNISDFTC